MRLAVAATAPFGADVLERLAARHEITALLTRPDAPRGRGRKTAAPPENMVNHVRALSPHIGVRSQLQGRPVTIWKARVSGRRFEPLEVQPDGKRRMTYDEFLRGLR